MLLKKIKGLVHGVAPKFIFNGLKRRHMSRIKKEYLREGTDRMCNLCNQSFPIFAPFGLGKDRMCPNCFSLERHRLLYIYLSKHTKLLAGESSILHFAPEKCIADKIMSSNPERYTTADLMIQYLPGIETKPEYEMSITDIKFPAETFDYFMCNHVLEHVPDDRKAMQEIYRVLKSGGKALIMVPINSRATKTQEDKSFDRHQRREFYGSQDHLRYYVADDLQAALEQTGFKVTQFTASDEMNKTLYQLKEIDIIFICQK